MKSTTYDIALGGKILTAEFTDLADQAHGSVIIRYGNTVVLATAVMGSRVESSDYFPLSVDYEEKFYAAGQILGSRFIRREGRPTDEAILSGRAVDRTIRPLFDSRMRNTVQVVITILSIGEDDPDTLAILGASLALGTSNIPWAGPVSALRLGRKRGDALWVVNPPYTFREGEDTHLDMLVCGKDGHINMIEAGGRETEERVVALALERALDDLTKLEEFQKKIISEIGKEKRAVEIKTPLPETARLFEETVAPKLDAAIYSGAGKAGVEALAVEWKAILEEKLPDEHIDLGIAHFDDAVNELLHKEILERERRPDGRKLDELREIGVKAGGVAPMLHGAGVFYRGGTHVLSALTLGGPQDSQLIDSMEIQDTKKRFMHHYNFPPFSTGETGRMGGSSRRAVGHGALAEKALASVIPPKETFPYTIRIVSEVLASNGSSSMGSVCAATLALMDAGVPITAPVAGIAMGLILNTQPTTHNLQPTTDGRQQYKILTDIQGPEDHHGDMDLKVAGTRKGVTAIQMDVKVSGVPVHVLAEALLSARAARIEILDVMESEIAAPRPNLPPHAPHIEIVSIHPKKIGLVIGGGGKTVNAIKDLTGVEVDIEDDGTVFITGDAEGTTRAREIVTELVREYKAGERFEGIVTRVVDFGAFVRISSEALREFGNQETEGLVHVSEIAPFRIERVGDAVAVSDTVPVIIKEIDALGRINLSIKDADPEFASRKGLTPAPLREHNEPRPYHTHTTHEGNSSRGYGRRR